MIKVTDQDFWMDPMLKSNLDSVVYNAKLDWDFVLPITGSGKTRVGKSVMGMQLGYYFSTKLGTPFSNDNVVFSGQELMNKALVAPPNSVFIYDESRGDLEGKKAIQKVHANLYDFFSECGMLNHIIILIMPDFFELQKGIAVNRSLFLINVRYGRSLKRVKGEKFVKFERGVFDFYDEKRKRMLYFMGKKNFNDYSCVKPVFTGSFPDHWTINKDEYDKRKLEFMRRNKEEESTTTLSKAEEHRNSLVKGCYYKLKLNTYDIERLTEEYGGKIASQTVSNILKKRVVKVETLRNEPKTEANILYSPPKVVTNNIKEGAKPPVL